ncbi:DUF1752 domain-containing protein [Mycena sanguinolenta]|uniref:DUF1752 domain-containing protein n=1 Tax=Mycena sanguinolenta TaxID=230812 RepID=A0A8H6Z0N3_9AGAR|nr:DUF1752 domain-containing protein [Mycena sanguinolenta]
MARYLPVLLVSVSTNATPDDSSLVVLPRGQVDYLSHEWAEEDVWRSWRNMTRHKNEIANGMRLENASWRTWWKQRNKLKTVTPETLNWLKDSDVTWLYGPLHTAVDWSPPPKPQPDPTEVGRVSSAEDRLDLAAKHKPILKHRSITEILQSDLPQSPVFSPADSEDEDEDADDDTLHATRPALSHTRSAPHVHQLPQSSLRKPSPPRVQPPSMVSASLRQNGLPRRHITFNTFVEQCIAVDSPRRPPLSNYSSGSSSNSNVGGSEPDGEARPRAAWDGRTSGALRWAGEDDESDDESNSHTGGWAGGSAISSDSDEDVLEVCLPRSRSNSSRGSSRSSNGRPSFSAPFSKTKTSKTIAPIPPARLKTTGVGNGWDGDEWVGTRDEGSQEEAYLPRSGATVDLAAQNVLSSAFDTDDSFEEDADIAPDGDGDEVYTHRSAYFSADGVYDYLGGPDIGVEFGPTGAREGGRGRQEPRGRRGSASAGAEILEIEGAASSPPRARSRSRPARPPPAIISSSPTNTDSTANVAASPSAASPRSSSGLLSPPPRGRDSSQSSSSSASQGRGRSATRTSSSSSLSERSRSSHTSPLGSLSPEYGGARASADYGGYPYGLVKSIRRGGNGSLSPDGGGGSVSPEKGVPPSVVSSTSTGTTTSSISTRTTSSSEGGDSTSNSGSSGATATRPRVEVNGGMGDDAFDGRGRGLQVRSPYTPANSPVVRIAGEPLFVSPANSTTSFKSSSGSATPPSGAQSQAPSPPSSSKSGSSPKKPTSPTIKSIPISPPRPRAIKDAQPQLVIDAEGDALPEEETDGARRSAPTPANSPVVRPHVPPRIATATAGTSTKEIGSATTKPAQSTAKSIPGPAARAPVSPPRATFQTSGTPATAGAANAKNSGSANSALQRTLGSPSAAAAIENPSEVPSSSVVGKAVGMVSNAGAYLGLWSGARESVSANRV